MVKLAVVGIDIVVVVTNLHYFRYYYSLKRYPLKDILNMFLLNLRQLKVRAKIVYRTELLNPFFYYYAY